MLRLPCPMPTTPALLFGRASHQPDDREVEAEAAESVGLESYQLELNALLEGNHELALATLPRESRRFLYRGWMLSEVEYQALEESLLERGHRLIVTSSQYAAAHYLPNWYPKLAGYTSRSVWTEGPDAAEAWALAQSLGPPPWLIKDHVKSAKESWHQACFIPPGASEAQFIASCEQLHAIRGERFERGFVVRRWLPFRTWGQTPSGPAYLEFRLFFARGRLVSAEPYFDAEDVEVPDFTAFERLARRIDSPFFTMDLADLGHETYAVVEVNDGGVSSLPASLDPRELFSRLPFLR